MLMYGILLFVFDIGKICVDFMCLVRDVGFECGIYIWDYWVWQDDVCIVDVQWIVEIMYKLYVCYCEIFGEVFCMYGVVGWQMNDYVFVQLDQFGMVYLLDGCLQLWENGCLVDVDVGLYCLLVFGKLLLCV